MIMYILILSLILVLGIFTLASKTYCTCILSHHNMSAHCFFDLRA
jgi:hypothetical protein